MKEKIEQLSKGRMNFDLPRIILSDDRITLGVEMGKRQNVGITVGNDADMRMKGLVFSSNPKVTVLTGQFVGSESVIEVSVNAEYAQVGDKITGELGFVTDCGEIRLPYTFTVTPPVLISINGPVKNMRDFADLAKSNWTAARKLFASEEFSGFINYHEKKSAFLRERLLKSPSVDIAMEQFLVATHRKVPLTVEFEKQEIEYDCGLSNFSDSIKIKKNTWGFISLNVACDMPFMDPDRELIRNEDFIGDEYDLKYVIYPERMAEGTNFCTLSITGCGVSAEIGLTARIPHADPNSYIRERRLKNIGIRLTENLIAHEMNAIPVGRFVSEGQALMDDYEGIEGADAVFANLVRALLLKVAGKESPAVALLQSVTGNNEAVFTPFTKGLSYYLEARLNPEVKDVSLEKIYALQDANPEEYSLVLLSFLLEDRFTKNVKLGFDELNALYNAGCNSPLMYLYAARILNTEPLLLKDTGDFETRAIYFALKHNYCSRDVARQYTSLVLRNGNFLKIHYNILTAVYERFQLKDTLLAICQMLIRNYKKDNAYFKWYRRGVEENLRIGDLYEYYMYAHSGDFEEDLDQSVLMYYVYNSKLNERKLAYLYANIVLHKDSNPIVYENYKEKIRLFASQLMRDGKNNSALSIIYNDCLSDDASADRYDEYLHKVIFRNEIECENPLMRFVCVAHRELDDEMVVPLINGQAQIDIFSENYKVFLLDAANNRYVPDDNTKIEKLISDDSLVKKAYACNRDKDDLIVCLADRAHRMRKYDQVSVDLRKQLLTLNNVSAYASETMLAELVLYFYDHAQDEITEEDIEKLEYKLLTPARRGKLAGLLILREQYDAAYRLMSECGYEDVDIKLLEKFATSLPQQQLGSFDKLISDIMYYLFLAGRRDEKIVSYLDSFYNGMTGDMYDIWQVGVDMKLATSDMDERLLAQILFTESFLPYAEKVYAHYHRRMRDRSLARAYFNFLAYKYLVFDVPLTKNSIDNMRRDSYYETNDIVLLALLKNYAVTPDLTQDEIDFAKNWLDVLNSRGKILPCFMNFAKYFRIPEDMEDKVYISYKSNPSHRVIINLLTRVDGRKTIREEAMRDVCYGMFVKEIVLFAGESVDYIITDDDGKNVTQSERFTVTGNFVSSAGGKSRFARINAIINARNSRDKSKSVELLNEYVKNEFAISQLFREI